MPQSFEEKRKTWGLTPHAAATARAAEAQFGPKP